MAHQITLIPARCLACGACELACDLQWRNVHPDSPAPPVPRIRLEVAGGRPLALQCRHCRNAPCLDACPTGAMRREHGRMFVDTERCAGCWSCVMVCPIGRVAPHIGEPSDEDSRTVPTFAFKCDGCPREGIAPCVRSCPTAALVATDPASPEAQMNRRRAYATRLLANAGLSDPKIKITER